MYMDFDSSATCGCGGRNTNGCGERRTWGVEGYPLASMYAPLQNFDKLYDEKTALKKGTIFSELDLPFMGESVYRGGCNRG